MTTPQSIPKFPKPFLKQVRDACNHYDKPKRIGKLPLATVALQSILLEQPDHATDLIGRAHALQSVLDLNIKKLKQAEEHYYLCLSCYIYARDPYNGKKIGQVGPYLEAHYSIPKPTYHNWISTKCLPLLSYHISQYLAQHAWVERSPKTPNFVGRDEQLAYYGQQLALNGVAVIQGPGGIGKTTLAAELLESIQEEEGGAVCWITIRRGLNDSVSGVLYGWAAFLAKQGYPQLWAFMRGTVGKEKKLTDFFPHLLIGFNKIAPLLCLDNLEIIPNKQSEFWTLLSMVQEQSQASLLLTSQTRPPLQGLNGYAKLGGLSPNEVQQLIQPHQIELTSQQLEALTLYSNGNPRLINLWLAHIMVKGLDHTGFFLVENELTSEFLLTQIINALSEGQQRAALLLALSRRPLDAFLLQHLPKPLRPLSDLEVEFDDFNTLQRLGIIANESANQWTVLPLLKEYLAEQATMLSFAEEIIDFHQWLADLYLLQANVMEAAYHAIEGGQAERALLWLARQQHQLIEQGQAVSMNTLLQTIPTDELSGPRKQLLYRLRIELLQLLGHYDEAKVQTQKARRQATRPIDEAQTYGMDGKTAVKRGEISQARDYYREALRILAIKQSTLEPWLHGELAWTLMEQNDLEEAWEEAERAQIELHNTFGHIARQQGKLNLAISHFEQAIAYGEELNERRKLTRVYNNLALTYWGKAKFQEAIVTFEANLKVIEEIGELAGKAITLLNIGLCYTQIGLDEPQKAITYFVQALPIFSTLGDVRGQMMANVNLAEQSLRIGELNSAHEYAQNALKVNKNKVPRLVHIEAQRIYAEILLTQGNIEKALEFSKQALNDLHVPSSTRDIDTFSNPFYAKLVCETLIKIHKALENKNEVGRYRGLARQLEEKIKG